MNRRKTAGLLANTNGEHGWAISTAVPRTMEGSVKPEHSRILLASFSDSLSLVQWLYKNSFVFSTAQSMSSIACRRSLPAASKAVCMRTRSSLVGNRETVPK